MTKLRRIIYVTVALALLLGAIPTSDASAQGRRLTGDGGTLRFDVNETAVGAYFQYDDGWFALGPCRLRTEATGFVISGVIGQLFPGEVAGIPVCVFQPPVAEVAPAPAVEATAPVGPPAPQPILTGKGLARYFTAGTPVAGYNIQASDFRQWRRCYFHNPSFNGWVTDGVIHPNPGQIAEVDNRVCDPDRPDIPPPTQAASQQPVPAAPPPVVAIPPPPPDPRQATGDGFTLRFGPGTPLFGAWIALDGGRTFAQCYMVAPESGMLTSGVLFPHPDEVARQIPCNFVQPGGQRIPTGFGFSLRFEAGTTVSGEEIRLFNGLVLHNCYVVNAPTAGFVRTGVIWPTDDEIRFMRRCW